MKPVADYAYTKLLEEQLSSNVRYFEDIRQPLDGLRHAAVALAVYDCQGEASVIVTRRSHSLREHSGQWALPGGRIDDGESPTDAALRELHEEVNLELGEESVIGTLDDYVTRSGYVITPVVVWADIDDRHLKANPDEVASIHPFTFTELSREDSPNLETIPESDRQVLSMNYFDDVLYAPTAAMLYQFREVALSGRSTRVLDYDQPVFAWR
ncbi:NUDIX hydrolase [marine gamma proteobacterium HTCC2143]|jgi:8-oxo-dGTP pyrophosphatase MutT (NUDIX family)|uniref:NUDIX hydrolase n=1 Tax=marine gamma proteobacterium HTCC2143 TaxID=247633 RepID=A0YAE3_9GAMM|nr:NUDIX hydrolase [marine gamma proteobacterium HTCC2143]